jgi:hypothetical protein
MLLANGGIMTTFQQLFIRVNSQVEQKIKNENRRKAQTWSKIRMLIGS